MHEQHTALIQRLFIENVVALRGYVLALMPDFGRVDDIVQETFMIATAKAADFQAGTNFRAWIFAIARRKVLEALRDPSFSCVALNSDVIESLSAGENDDLWQDRHLLALGDCVARLAPQARKVIELRYQQAHRPPEIAQLMGWTINAVNVALARSRSALRACVDAALRKEPV